MREAFVKELATVLSDLDDEQYSLCWYRGTERGIHGNVYTGRLSVEDGIERLKVLIPSTKDAIALAELVVKEYEECCEAEAANESEASEKETT